MLLTYAPATAGDIPALYALARQLIYEDLECIDLPPYCPLSPLRQNQKGGRGNFTLAKLREDGL